MRHDAPALIRRAGAADAEQLGVVAPAAYAEAYDYLWNDAQAYGRHLQSFGKMAFIDGLAHSDTSIWVAEIRRTIIGFATLIMGSPDPINGCPAGAELRRLYLLGPARGCGLGRDLLAVVEAYAHAHGAHHIWLDVMDSAPWAIHAYLAWGFKTIGSSRFPNGVRPELETLLVLQKATDVPSHKGR